MAKHINHQATINFLNGQLSLYIAHRDNPKRSDTRYWSVKVNDTIDRIAKHKALLAS